MGSPTCVISLICRSEDTDTGSDRDTVVRFVLCLIVKSILWSVLGFQPGGVKKGVSSVPHASALTESCADDET